MTNSKNLWYFVRTFKFLKTLLFAFLFFVLQVQFCLSQSPILLDKTYNNLTWEEFLTKVEEDYKYHIFSLFDSIPTERISINEEGISIKDLMKSYQINVSFDMDNNIFLTKNYIIRSSLSRDFFQNKKIISVTNNQNKEDSFLDTKNEYFQETVIIGSPEKRYGKSKYDLYGFMKNKEDGEPVIGGTIYIKELEQGAVTTPTGHYSISLPPGEYTLEISSIGRKPDKKLVKIYSDGQLDIDLKQELVALDEVVVVADRYDNVKNNKLGFEKIPVKNIREIPVILGERDVMKVALMLPGIQTTGEGSSGFNVRGSPADQNLFYINDAPLYNTSHLFGFFSVFNSDAISDFSIYKGHIPVNYGGRLASIFEVTTKNGNNQNFSARGGISPITGKVLMEGPIVKGKGSCLAAFRTTYSDWLLKLVEDPDIRSSNAQFQDGLINLSFDVTPLDKIKLFTYQSSDRINLAGDQKYKYYNQGYSLRWNHIVRQKHTLSASLVSAKYGYVEENRESDILSYTHDYSLRHDEAKLNLELRPNINHTVSIGGNAILYNLDRGEHLPLEENSTVNPVVLGREKGLEASIYIGDEWDITSRLNLSMGTRLNYYASLGSKTVYTYADNAPRTINNIVDSLSYGKNQLIKDYINPDFRVALKYLLYQNTSVKASYNRLYQDIFMLSNTISISPSDQWKLVDKHIKPLEGEQYSVGLYQKLFRKQVDFTMEAYYKTVKNLVEYKDGVDLLVNEIVETDILQGSLTSYGVELNIKKPLGRLNGWANYVYSRATVLVDSDIEENQINFGQEYPANFEKPHSFNLVANYKFSRRISFSSSLVYSTGRPITYPVATYEQGGTLILHYSKRNEYRIPDYFRIDASLSLEGNLRSKKWAHGSWMFSVYNLTGRQNAYSVYFRNEDVVKGYKLSIFGRPIFTVTYNFKLGNYAS